MSKTTDNYRFVVWEYGDIVYPGLDQRNVQTVENQLQALYSFVGPGVISGWDVEKMRVLPVSDPVEAQKIRDERDSLSQANSNTFMNRQYRRLLGTNLPLTDVKVATTGNITLSGLQTIDGILVSADDRVLVKDQTTKTQNGIYLVKAGSWLRSTDLDINSEVISGISVRSESGTVGASGVWQLLDDSDGYIIGTTELIWVDLWSQVIRVLPGNGVVGSWSAHTSDIAYFRFDKNNIYYVWAEFGPCLIAEGKALLSAPINPDEEYDTIRTATYLASVEVAETSIGSGVYYVDRVVYDDRRKLLKNLAGELDKALKKAFYRHVHLGGSNYPSKIVLDTELVFNATAPVGSTIFFVRNANGSIFTWSAADYGIPEVRLNNSALPESAYGVSPGAGKIFLKNSIPETATLQLILPLSAQKKLYIHPDSQITDAEIFLTDGTSGPIDEGGFGGEEQKSPWDNGLYHPPLVLLQGTPVDTDLYSVSPSRASLKFSPLLTSPYVDDDLEVILTHIGDQITGKLSGKRIGSIDAATFTKGKLDSKRINNLDHVGQVRYKELASLQPVLRLFGEGNHRTFYPEIIGSPMQYGTDVFKFYSSINISSLPILIGTKRGLMQTSNMVTIISQPSWNIDKGQVIDFIDDILPAEPFTNRFHTTYLRTIEGRIFRTKDGGSSWAQLQMPSVATATVPVIPNATAFHAATHREEEVLPSGLKKYTYYDKLFMGTDKGLWTVQYIEGTSDDNWDWSSNNTLDEDSGTIYALEEIVTMHRVVSEGSTTESYDRTLYSGGDQGLYIGNNQVTTDLVKGFMWIKDSNNLGWFTNNDVFISHTGRYEVDADSETETTFWHHPLSERGVKVTDVRASTTANITLSGLQTVDGVVLANGNRVLVKNQTTTHQNGIYVVAVGSWTRATDLDANGEVVTLWTRVTEGTLNAGSAWKLVAPTSPIIGTSPLLWENLWVRPLHNVGTTFTDLVKRSGFNQYFAIHTTGIYLITDVLASNVWTATPTVIPWDSNTQGEPKTIINISSGFFTNGILVVGSSRGVWQTNDLGVTWERLRKEFSQTAKPTIYNEDTDEVIIAPPTSIHSELLQSFQFGSDQPLWQNMVYERDYQNYYVSPWNAIGAEVVVYVDGLPTNIPYSLDANLGKISFTRSLQPTNEVRATIVRTGAFITNVGTTPHAEQPQSFVVGSIAVTNLADESDLSPADMIIKVQNPLNIPVTTKYLELRSRENRERVQVNINPITREISILRPRTTGVTYPRSTTEIYLVSIENVLGIEDRLSQASSGQTYHLNSVVGTNVLQLSIAAKNEYSDLFDNYYGVPDIGEADRGPKNALFFNFNTDTPDPLASSSSHFVGLVPTENDSPSVPHTVYAINNATAAGTGMRVGTDQGIWRFENSKWNKESDLDGAVKQYFFATIDGALAVGTDKGLYVSSNNTWSLNSTFPRPVFDYSTGSWFGGTYQAWAKEDGLSFVYTSSSTEGFTSDHFDALDDKRIYGLFKAQFIRLSGEPPDQKQEYVDALYLCTEEGLFGVTQGTRDSQYSSLLNGREMFGSNPLRVIVNLPNGGTASVPVKIYKIFQSARPKTVPIMILTNNGVYKVRDWRWCDPGGGGDFDVEAHQLTGISCYCFANITSGSDPNFIYKSFIGTSQGVYRSYNDGASWERCERIGGNNTPVYDLEVVNGGLIAGTESGLYYSDNDGDDWQRPTANGNSYANYNYRVANTASFNGSYLAQSFKTAVGFEDLTKVSLYLSTELPTDPTELAASLENKLEIAIYSTNGGTLLPQTALATTPSDDMLVAEDVAYPGFWSVTLPVTVSSGTATYAIVAREIVQSGGVSVFRWHSSVQNNPYADGRRINGTPGNWTAVSGEDFYFRVYQDAPVSTTETLIPANFPTGLGRGTAVNDSNELTTDLKLAMSIVVDDSRSIAWSDPSNRREAEITDLLETLWGRTTYTLGTGLFGTLSPTTYAASYADFWLFSTDELERTDGYSNNLTSLIQYAAALNERGNASLLYETTEIAISGLSPQSLVDAVIKTDEQLLTVSNMQRLVQYLNDRDILRLTDLQAWHAALPNPKSAWDGTAAQIPNFDDIATYVAERWANSFVPVAVVFADGDGEGDADSVVLTANSGWDNDGFPIYTYGLGRSHTHPGLRSMAALTGGKHLEITDGTNGQDWDDAKTSFMHEGSNNLFVSYWTKEYDFAAPKWVRAIQTVFTTPTGAVVNSSCTVEAQFTKDRVNWSTWNNILSAHDFTIDDEILGLRYRVTMKDGWTGTATVRPKVSSLGYIEVTPAYQYLITPTYNTNGMIFEYILSAAVNLPRSARTNWGIVRGDSNDFADFETILNGSKGCLSNRQESLQFTTVITREKLITTTTNNQIYQVVEDSLPARWATTDQVTVYQGNFAIDPERANYSLDGERGIVYFDTELPSQVKVTVTIVTPENLFTGLGEPTTTRDGRTFYLVNGRWSHDATAIVLINGQIKRGGFWISPEDGTVTFSKELESTDIVTVFIETASKYRVGVEIKNYSNDPIVLDNFGLFYTTTSNFPLLYRYNNTPKPTLVGKPVILPPTPSIRQRMEVSYTFKSIDGNEENGTEITWWRKRGVGAFTQITVANSLPEYNNRTVERTIDVAAASLFQQGDQVYVEVTPSDGFSSGSMVRSDTITLLGNYIPYIHTVFIAGTTEEPADSGVFYATAGLSLEAKYTFVDGDAGPNQSTVVWHLQDGEEVYFAGEIIPEGMTENGETLSFTVTPYDGQHYGIPVFSEYVTIR